MPAITIQKQDNQLHLGGVLDCNTLNQLWQNRIELLTKTTAIDVSQLTRVDSAGLALLTDFCITQNIKLASPNQQLKMLIELYDLDSVVL